MIFFRDNQGNLTITCEVAVFMLLEVSSTLTMMGANPLQDRKASALFGLVIGTTLFFLPRFFRSCFCQESNGIEPNANEQVANPRPRM